ncbi:hypothetical protein KIW84_011363 [Lathyrus oleraceus]|uniref:Uncharacterized protein n=1 Tax=Pisum sativum TaxID=3888 RepID=A0A9D5BER3_PEA|nr:hypothetical protein KIW84_011363 [Pisum sativum]
MIGTKKCLDEFIISPESTRKVNPEYEDWQAYDQQLFGWFKYSMTPGIATQLLHCESSKQLWEEAQSLAGAHQGLDLDSEYNPIVVKLSDQTSLSWIDLQSQLLSSESDLNKSITSTISPSMPQQIWPTRQIIKETEDATDLAQMEIRKDLTSEVGGVVKEEAGWTRYHVSGTSNHVTNQTGKFQNLIEHHGKNSLVVGYGEKLKIMGTGNLSNDSTTTITEEPQDADGDTNQVTHPP